MHEGNACPLMFEWLTHVIRPRLGPPEEPSRRSLKPSTLKKSFMILRFWPAPFPSCSKFWAADRCRFRCDGRFEERRVLGKARQAAAVKSLTVVSFELFGGFVTFRAAVLKDWWTSGFRLVFGRDLLRLRIESMFVGRPGCGAAAVTEVCCEKPGQLLFVY
ncbi:hypothetical protein HBI63_186610 [Parastagonospora nodorum]|nr:hypothetical protein HBI63_186610 [Parastagonospora nodorum]KAH6171261.1 hypothetical protein HBI61_184980 [Parastagonospora nodorum]